jgi:hypothetical protein
MFASIILHIKMLLIFFAAHISKMTKDAKGTKHADPDCILKSHFSAGREGQSTEALL